MKIFHSFDTKLKQKKYDKLRNSFGEDKVLLITRSFFFWFFKGFITLTLHIGFSILFYYYAYLFIYQYFITGANTLLISWILLSIIILYKVYRVYLNYKMDFCLVTPEEIMTYKQKGILKSSFKNIPINKLKSIQSKHNGIIGNILNFGNITILTDGGLGAANDKDPDDESGAGMIKLTYVHRPNRTKEKISTISIHEGSINDSEEDED